MAGIAAVDDGSSGIDSRYRWVILSGVWFLYYCFGLILSSLAPLVSVIVEDLKMSLSSMGRVLGAWQFVYLFSAIPIGIAIDRFGLRLSLTIAALLVAASAVLRGLAGDGFTLWLAVAVFGLGGPIISIGAPKVIASWFGSSERGTAMGIYMTGPSLGNITAVALSNSVLMPLTGYDWRSVLFILSMVAGMAAVCWYMINLHPLSRLGETTSAKKPVGETLAVFVMLLRIPVVIVILIMSIGIFTINHGLGNWLPEILRAGGMTIEQAGYWAAIPTLIGVIGSLTIPRLATAERRLYILILLFLCCTLAMWLLRTGEGSTLASGLILQGISRSSMMTLAILILMETPAVGAKNIGIAGGLFFTAAEIGGVFGPGIIGILADHSGGFDTALWLLFVLSATLTGLAFFVKKLSDQKPEPAV